MKAITLTLPWAVLWLAPNLRTGKRAKEIESRSWCVAAMRGRRLGVHSAAGVRPDVRGAISDGVVFREPYCSALMDAGYCPLDPWDTGYLKRVDEFNRGESTPLKPLIRGAMLGAVTIEDIIPGSAVLHRHHAGRYSALEMALGNYDESKGKRYGWVSIAPRMLDTPVVCRGYQNLWEMPDDVEKEMQLAGIA